MEQLFTSRSLDSLFIMNNYLHVGLGTSVSQVYGTNIYMYVICFWPRQFELLLILLFFKNVFLPCIAASPIIYSSLLHPVNSTTKSIYSGPYELQLSSESPSSSLSFLFRMHT